MTTWCSYKGNKAPSMLRKHPWGNGRYYEVYYNYNIQVVAAHATDALQRCHPLNRDITGLAKIPSRKADQFTLENFECIAGYNLVQ